MEREIKARGKRLDNGEWAKGFYYEVEELHFIIPDSAILNSVTQSFAKDDFLQGFVEVIPETVGEFTGLKDKNDKDLDWWEGDLFNLTNHSGVVEIVQKGGCFWFRNPATTQRWPCYRVATWVLQPIKVGNKWDNPELLGSVEA